MIETIPVEELEIYDYLIAHEGEMVYEMRVITISTHNILKRAFLTLLMPDGDGRVHVDYPLGTMVERIPHHASSEWGGESDL
jgi:hypothetical protein